MPRIVGSLLSFSTAVVLAGLVAAPLHAQESGGAGAARCSSTRAARSSTFQLKRLTNPQLLAVERKTDHPKYIPVYEAILVRKDMERKFRQEAADGLAALNKSDPVVEILDGIGKADDDDAATRGDLVGLLLTQKPDGAGGAEGEDRGAGQGVAEHVAEGGGVRGAGRRRRQARRRLAGGRRERRARCRCCSAAWRCCRTRS